jgi:hypothetical protein
MSRVHKKNIIKIPAVGWLDEVQCNGRMALDGWIVVDKTVKVCCFVRHMEWNTNEICSILYIGVYVNVLLFYYIYVKIIV